MMGASWESKAAFCLGSTTTQIFIFPWKKSSVQQIKRINNLTANYIIFLYFFITSCNTYLLYVWNCCLSEVINWNCTKQCKMWNRLMKIMLLENNIIYSSATIFLSHHITYTLVNTHPFNCTHTHTSPQTTRGLVKILDWTTWRGKSLVMSPVATLLQAFASMSDQQNTP